jgi:hypothetical protein
MGMNSKSRIAGGTINPFVFIQGIPGVELGALQCSGAGVEIIGIGAEWTNSMMGANQQTTLVPQGFPAATTGQDIKVYEDGEDTIIMVGSGYTVQPDNLLVSDASGNAIPINLAAAGVQWVGARAVEAGVAGSPIRVSVYTRPYYNA